MANLDYNLIAQEILKGVGGPNNVANATNCMTRLRIIIIDTSAFNKEAIEKINGVLQVINDGTIVQVVLGPGKVVKVTNEFNNLIKLTTRNLATAKIEKEEGLSIDSDWKTNKEKVKGKQKRLAWLSKGMRHLANIFSPLIPGIIAAGLFAAIGSIICSANGVTAGADIANKAARLVWQIAQAFSQGFTAYLVIFVGVNAAKEFGASPMLGGFIGGICSIANINEIAKMIGLYNTETPLKSTLMSGKGGVIGVIFAVWLLALLEKFLHKKMPNSLDTVFTPFLSILVIGLVYVFGIMIVAGYISDGICWVIGKLTLSKYVIVRIIIGFVASALFLPLVMAGMHHGLVAFYATEKLSHGFVSLYPALAMAGAGQVGAAIALYIKARRMKNNKLQSNITSSIIPGILGVGEPLIYSVTVPLGSPFLTAGLGAGIGGAFVMAMQVGSTAWGPSGFIAIPLMTWVNGAQNPLGMLWYTISLFISIAAGFLFTWFFIKENKVKPKELTPQEIAFKKH